MADLTGTTPADTYKGLLQVNDYTDGVDATAKYIQDGEGTDSALAISTDNVGIGTTSPSAKLEVVGNSVNVTESNAVYANSQSGLNGSLTLRNEVGSSGVAGNNVGIVFRNDSTGNSFARISYIASVQEQDGLRYSNLVFGTDDGVGNRDEKMRITSAGNVGIGTTNFGTNASGVIGIGNATAPTSSPADMVQLYAEDVTASSELRVRDEAGNVTTLSPHAKDAPDSLYDNGKGVDEMHRVANHYLGTIVFTNVDRRNDLMQKQLNGEELPEDRTFKVTETFAEYNARTGADLQVEDWDANQQAMFDAQEEKVVARQAEIDAWDNEEEEAPEPLQSYVKKPKPDWLS